MRLLSQATAPNDIESLLGLSMLYVKIAGSYRLFVHRWGCA